MDIKKAFSNSAQDVLSYLNTLIRSKTSASNNFASPVPEKDTLNDPGKLNYVAEDSMRQSGPLMSDGSAPIKQQQPQEPVVKLSNFQVQPKPPVVNGEQQFIQWTRKNRPQVNYSDQKLSELYKKYGNKIYEGLPDAPQKPTMGNGQPAIKDGPVQTIVKKVEDVIHNFRQPAFASNDGDFSGFTTSQVPPTRSNLILKAAKDYGIDPNVLASLLFTEHGFSDTPGYNYNTNGSYDRGPAQINNKAHPEVTDEQALDPNFAVDFAGKTLGGHLKNFGGDYNKAIAAYNVGGGGAMEPGQTPSGMSQAAQNYLNKVGYGLTPDLRKKYNLKVAD